MSQYGQMLAAAQAFATPEQQRKLAQTQSQASEYAVGKEKKSQQEELEALMEAEMKKASEKKGKFGFLGDLGKLAGFFMPGVGAGLQALSGASQASSQKKALKKLMKDPKFKGTWLGDPTKQYLKDVEGLAGDIDPLKTGLTSFATSMATGKMMKGIGDKVGGMFKAPQAIDELGYSIDPTFGDMSKAIEFTGEQGGPLKNLMANIKVGGGIGGGGLEDLFKDFDLMDIVGKGAGGQENLQALPLLMQLFGGGGGGFDFSGSDYTGGTR